MTRPDRLSRLGFTLLELILVLVLIATLTTLATPALNGFTRRAQLDGTAVALLTLTEQARTRTAHTAVPHRIVFDLDQRRAWVQAIGDEGYETVHATGSEPVTWPRAMTVTTDLEADGDALDTNQFVIDFQPNGLLTPGSVVIEQQGRHVALTCPAATERYRLATPAELDSRNAAGVLHALQP